MNAQYPINSHGLSPVEFSAAVARAHAERGAILGRLVAFGLGAARAVVTAFKAWRERETLRHELSQMTDFELADIGLVRSDIEAVVTGTYHVEPESPKALQAANQHHPLPEKDSGRLAA
ncbi:MAG: DUF1127 domain-containing protein [Rhodospirillales bacterium]|nr:DUF1127 domain-containing protein [Rhodospirillales bacterium]